MYVGTFEYENGRTYLAELIYLIQLEVAGLSATMDSLALQFITFNWEK